MTMEIRYVAKKKASMRKTTTNQTLTFGVETAQELHVAVMPDNVDRN